jgi:Uma2 family endonuclease
MSAARQRSVSWERFLALPDHDKRELIDGQLIHTEMTTTRTHEHIVACVVFFFRGWSRQHGGFACASGYKLRIDSRHGFLPDAQLYHPHNRAEVGDAGCLEGAPDVVLEVLSPGSARYDRRVKLLGYARVGVGEYWIASQEDPTVERLVLRRGKYVVEQVLTPGDVLRPPRFPGLEIPVAELYQVGPVRRSRG